MSANISVRPLESAPARAWPADAAAPYWARTAPAIAPSPVDGDHHAAAGLRPHGAASLADGFPAGPAVGGARTVGAKTFPVKLDGGPLHVGGEA